MRGENVASNATRKAVLVVVVGAQRRTRREEESRRYQSPRGVYHAPPVQCQRPEILCCTLVYFPAAVSSPTLVGRCVVSECTLALPGLIWACRRSRLDYLKELRTFGCLCVDLFSACLLCFALVSNLENLLRLSCLVLGDSSSPLWLVIFFGRGRFQLVIIKNANPTSENAGRERHTSSGLLSGLNPGRADTARAPPVLFVLL